MWQHLVWRSLGWIRRGRRWLRQWQQSSRAPVQWWLRDAIVAVLCGGAMYGFFAYLLVADVVVRTVAWGLYLIVLLAAAWFNARAAMHPIVGAPIGIATAWLGAVVFLLLIRLDHPWGRLLTSLILAAHAPSGQGPIATYGAVAMFGVLGAWLATYRSGTVPIRKRQRKYYRYR